MEVPGRKSVVAGSDEVLDCDPCNNEGTCVQAEGYCVDCKEYLCVACFTAHGKLKATKYHNCFNKECMPKFIQLRNSDSTMNVCTEQRQSAVSEKRPYSNANMRQNVDVEKRQAVCIVKQPDVSVGKRSEVQADQCPDVCTERCPTHCEKVLEYYCKTHDQLGCTVCMTVNHKSCKGVNFIPDIADTFENSQNYKQFMTKVEAVSIDAKQNRETANNHCAVAETFSEEANKRLCDFRQEMNSLFAELDDVVRTEVNAIRDEDMTTMNTLSDECDAINADIVAMTAAFENKKKAKQNCSLFVSVKNAEKEIKSMEEQMKTIGKKNKIRKYKFDSEKQTTDIRNSLKKLKKVSVQQSVIRREISDTKLSSKS